MSTSERVTSCEPFDQRVGWYQGNVFGCSSVGSSFIVSCCAYLGEDGEELDMGCIVPGEVV